MAESLRDFKGVVGRAFKIALAEFFEKNKNKMEMRFWRKENLRFIL